MFKSRRCSALSRSPLCANSAPQQRSPGGNHTSQPASCKSLTAASCDCGYRIGITQPTRNATRCLRSPIAGATLLDGGWNCRRSLGSWRPERKTDVSFSACAARVAIPKARRRRGCASICRNANLLIVRLADGRRRRSTSARPASMIRPYGTPEGHTASHVRQPRQRSIWRTCSSSKGSVPRFHWVNR